MVSCRCFLPSLFRLPGQHVSPGWYQIVPSNTADRSSSARSRRCGRVDMRREESADMPGVIRNLNRREFTATAAATPAATALSVQPLSGKEATPAGSSSNASAAIQIDVVATGLADPRFITTDGNTVYFTESGTGGDTAVFEIAGEGTPEPTSPVSQRGTT